MQTPKKRTPEKKNPEKKRTPKTYSSNPDYYSSPLLLLSGSFLSC